MMIALYSTIYSNFIFKTNTQSNSATTDLLLTATNRTFFDG